ncbi:MAPEG family protein [Thalassobaculum sp. OXR-137]|uniref:MAPEG family protein n=1 Tax=Thalassobaculum sp. OXR-137 TaxID=3100173 RepID=UPI002AC9658C|nr:MAPEG family protein [Thalassobaculum sp. OXR-137]WPZ33581.1 MAPEG family protein [Thalassobaculum sp. OXR-137]
METFPFEIRVLAWSGLLAAGQLVLLAVYANLQLGPRYLASARDEPRQLTGMAARLQRAFQNQIEGLVLFSAAAVAVTLAGMSSATTEACALAYIVARVVYIPLYWFGVAWLRTVAWAIGFFATVVMLVSVVL